MSDRLSRKSPHSNEIPLDTTAVVESTYVHQRHNRPAGSASDRESASRKRKRPELKPLMTKNVGTVFAPVDPGEDTIGTDITPAVFGAPANCPPHRAKRRGSAPVAPFFSNGRLHEHHHTTRHADNVARHGGHHNLVTTSPQKPPQKHSTTAPPQRALRPGLLLRQTAAPAPVPIPSRSASDGLLQRPAEAGHGKHQPATDVYVLHRRA